MLADTLTIFGFWVLKPKLSDHPQSVHVYPKYKITQNKQPYGNVL